MESVHQISYAEEVACCLIESNARRASRCAHIIYIIADNILETKQRRDSRSYRGAPFGIETCLEDGLGSPCRAFSSSEFDTSLCCISIMPPC